MATLRVKSGALTASREESINSGRVNVERLVKTKIVCTLGPASDNEETLEKMILAGMDVVRLNFSHSSHEYHKSVFDMVRKLAEKHDQQVSILCDIQGPKIRIGQVKEPFVIRAGDKIRVTPDEVEGSPERVSIQYETILNDLDAGDVIYVNDGIVKLVVQGIEGRDLVCVCEAGGMLSTHKGCNIPSGNISMNVITEKDEKDLEFIAKLDPEFVAASFIGTAEDVGKVRAMLEKFGNSNIKIISKIERPVAVRNIDSIIEVTDGIMVARGDLGVEIPTYAVPTAQKTIVKKCNREGKYVIVATQMLESMTGSARPTRAEASDVYNAVLDGADAVMLSGETSVGKYVIDAVKVMDSIVDAAQEHMAARNPNEYDSEHKALQESIAHATYTLSQQMKTAGWPNSKILVLTTSGRTARLIGKYRPQLPIIAMSHVLRTCRELNLVWGVRSVHIKDDSYRHVYIEQKTEIAVRQAYEMGLVTLDDRICMVSGTHKSTKLGMFCGIVHVAQVLAAAELEGQ